MTPEEIVAEVAKQPHLIHLIASEVGDQVDRKIQEREGRLLKLLTVITAIIIFIGYSGIRELISAAADKAVDTALEKRVAEFEVSGTIANVQAALLSAETTKKFSNTARDGMIRSIEVLASARDKGAKVSENPAFRTVLEKIVDTMASSNNDILADKIFDLFPDDCLKASGIVETYLQHYGRQGAVGVGDIRLIAAKRFGEFERAASTYKVPETALAHRILIDFQASDGKHVRNIDDAIARLGGLNEVDRSRAWEFWSQYAREQWVTRSTDESKSLKKFVVTFIKSYQKELRPIFSKVDDIIADAESASGTDSKALDEKRKLMDLLKSLDGVKG